MQAIILAGGLGIRLRSLVNDRPKPMALVNQKPFLEYILMNLRKHGIKEVVLAVGYMNDCIKNYFFDGKQLDLHIRYSVENKQLGTGGAILNALNLVNDEKLLILNGDTYFNVDYNKMLDFSKKNNSRFTIALRLVDDSKRYGVVELDESNKIINFVEKNKASFSSYINAGTYLINKELLSKYEQGKFISLEQDIVPSILKNYSIYGFKCKAYFKDIGIPDDYKSFCKDVLVDGCL